MKYMLKYTCKNQGVQLNSRLNILEFDRSQADRPTAPVIAQQYSVATIFSLRIHSHNENFGAYKKKKRCYFSFYVCLLKLRKLTFRKWGMFGCVRRESWHTLHCLKINVNLLSNLRSGLVVLTVTGSHVSNETGFLLSYTACAHKESGSWSWYHFVSISLEFLLRMSLNYSMSCCFDAVTKQTKNATSFTIPWYKQM